ncbi:MAG: ATP-binding domain-containing protein, partial [Pseudonocardiaceae bacterium]
SGQGPVFTTTTASGLPDAVAAAVTSERVAIGAGTLAVIVPYELLEAIRQVLPGAGEGPRLLDAAVALLTTKEAKGLEFDTVVVVEPAAIVAESPQGARALYLALTRSTRRLHIVHSQSLPPGLVAPGATSPTATAPASASPTSASPTSEPR